MVLLGQAVLWGFEDCGCFGFGLGMMPVPGSCAQIQHVFCRFADEILCFPVVRATFTPSFYGFAQVGGTARRLA
ncbi:MAG: hypothetical protein ACJAZW_002521 [Maritalea sp.]|jgi:hypothetical protein